MPDIVSFVRRWNASTLTERASYQQHFRDLCEALDVPWPTQEDQTDATYTYEKRVAKAGTGEQGFADVWRRGWFAWEYKSKGGDLKKAYKQLNEYHEALENPPLLIVCDFVRFEVHTKFENAPPRVYAFTLDDLLTDRDTATCALPPIEVLRHVFGDYNQLRPSFAAVRVTRATALDFLRLARQLDLERALDTSGATPHDIARFLMRLVFCLFADSVELLPNHTFRRLIEIDRLAPDNFNRKLPVLFEAMSQDRSFFGAENIPYFNGGLFTDDATIELNLADLGILYSASQHDWSHIEPAIFGTLFETALNQEKRDQLNRSGQTDVQAIGVHYTSPDDILLLVEPVVMQPLRRRWESVQASILAALAEEAVETGAPPSPTVSSSAKVGSLDAASLSANGAATSQPGAQPQESASDKSRGLKARYKMPAKAKASLKPQPSIPLALRPNRPAQQLLNDWAAELSAVRVLDPACGSGNFLYVTLKRLLDLWHDARIFGSRHDLKLDLDPMPNPEQLFGIELNFYAHEVASLSVWIGFLQWKRDHGIKDTHSPLLRKLDNIQHDDAILRRNTDGEAYEPEWPEADFIVGNPPFLGDKMMRGEMGDEYVTDLRSLYAGRVPGGADLVTYWFEKARAQIEAGHLHRAGLIATNSIRIVGNRPVLERIKQSGDIFMAWSDNPWVLNGAAVRISLVAFDDGMEPTRVLDGNPVKTIHADLTAESNVTSALPLEENEDLCFLGVMKGGPFDITDDEARKMLASPINPNGRPNSDVVKRRLGGRDITSRDSGGWLIDFGAMTEEDAALYEWPFEYVKTHVKPLRDANRDAIMHRNWWLHGRTRPALRAAIANLSRCIVTPEVAKHRIFVWMDTCVVPDHTCHVIARADDYFFGLLHSRVHEQWSLSQGAWMGVGNDPRYSSARTFDTFPFPWPPGTEPSETNSPIVKAIAAAARNLVQLRDNWLNPTPLPTEDELKNRTLTKLYNERPTWLANAHRTLDEAVFAAYGWPLELDGKALTDQEILARLLALNHQRAAAQTDVDAK
jgi:type II restriction/modification system DNA methylase subunit YeeA